MLRVAGFLAAIGAFAPCSCTRLSESSLTGTWRAETTEIVEEIALRSDHTFTSWTSAKGVLTTPSCPTSAGEWRLQGRNILIHLTTHLELEGWQHEDKHFEFTVVKVSRDAMQLKDSQGNGVNTYKRLFPDYNVRARTRNPIDSDLFGVWRFHYNTHDYEMVLERDHSFGVFVYLPNWRQPAKGDVRHRLWTGTWRIADGEVVTDAKTVPSFEGESIETRRSQWPIIGIERDRIAVREGPVRYLWQRLN
jgi:hypothetical protein